MGLHRFGQLVVAVEAAFAVVNLQADWMVPSRFEGFGKGGNGTPSRGAALVQARSELGATTNDVEGW